jgi:prepilin-type N-terminal cleavage/methylation domain-containing protein
MRAKAFTLIELLIVVAIIAILAAIATPNFLEAQIRSKVARTQNDLRTQAVALEAFCVDHNTYTRDSDSSLDVKDHPGVDVCNPYNPEWVKYANGAIQLTTPVAYMSSLLSDPFAPGGTVAVSGGAAVGYRIASGSWSYASPADNPDDNQGSAEVFAEMGRRSCYALIGVGPDQNRARMGYKCFPFMPANATNETPVGGVNSKGQPIFWCNYDATNGTKSVGDIYRFGGSWQDGRFLMDGVIIGSQAPVGGTTW